MCLARSGGSLIESGAGYAEVRVTDPYAYWVAGLGSGNGNARVDQIDFAFGFNGDGRADVLEDGVFQEGTDTTCEEGDVFRVAVVDGRVRYVKNGRILHESRRSPR